MVLQLFCIVYFDPFNEFQGQNGFAAQLPEDLRGYQKIGIGKIAGKALNSMGFASEIQFTEQGATKFTDDPRRVEKIQSGQMVFNQIGETGQDIQICFEQSHNARATDLYGDQFAAVKTCPVHLGNRACGDGNIVKFGVKIFQWRLELFFDFGAD